MTNGKGIVSNNDFFLMGSWGYRLSSMQVSARTQVFLVLQAILLSWISERSLNEEATSVKTAFSGLGDRIFDLSKQVNQSHRRKL